MDSIISGAAAAVVIVFLALLFWVSAAPGETPEEHDILIAEGELEDGTAFTLELE